MLDRLNIESFREAPDAAERGMSPRDLVALMTPVMKKPSD